VPVLVLDLDDREAAKLLALCDPLAGMAEADQEVLADLVREVETDSEAVRSLLDQMLAGSETPAGQPEGDAEAPEELDVSESFQVVVECNDEAQQQAVYERMTAEGFKCRVLTL
jgi:hypothetical protein